MDPYRRRGHVPACCCLLLVMACSKINHIACWLGCTWHLSEASPGDLLHANPARDVFVAAWRPDIQSPAVTLAARGRGDVSTVGSQDLNLYGQELQPCSQEGDTTTGWTRTGLCAWEPSDRGYHQVCVTMSRQFLKSSAKYDANDLSSVVDEGGHWCICAWAWAAAVSRDPENYENLKLDCARTNAYLRDVYQSYAISGRDMASPSGLQYKAQAALEAVEKLCKA